MQTLLGAGPSGYGGGQTPDEILSAAAAEAAKSEALFATLDQVTMSITITMAITIPWP